uniref:Uncharacterized protein n=1 Tax=Megaselia scalaris TaxID=36166 RepID=T1GUJ5_MEGSC
MKGIHGNRHGHEKDNEIKILTDGTDGIPVEMLKTAGASFNRVLPYYSEEVPNEWNFSIS